MRKIQSIICLHLIASIFAVNIEMAVQHLKAHAKPRSINLCARFVANALYAGGFRFPRQGSAYMYHTNGVLRNIGYREINRPNFFMKGDITVTERSSRYPHGHIAMWSGENWISDFKQNSEFVYRSPHPRVHYYRYGSSGPEPPKPTEQLIFTYAVRTTDGKILPEVQNTNDYAGKRGYAITDIAIKVNRGRIKYRVHVKNGNWLKYAHGYNWNDYLDGYAGNGKPIDLIEIVYEGDETLPLYRVSPINQNYYPWQKGNYKGSGFDGYAGSYGKTIDRIQINSS